MRSQLLGTWLIGSVVGGTIALLLHSEDQPVKPLFLLGAAEAVALVVLVGALVMALFVLGRRTIGQTWLRWQDPRSAVLWTALVAGAGLAGWGFAAVITFELGFPLGTQLLLAYTSGGLPFMLVAAMLARPWRVNVAAAAVTVFAVLAGLTTMDRPLQTLVLYLEYFLGGPFRAL